MIEDYLISAFIIFLIVIFSGFLFSVFYTKTKLSYSYSLLSALLCSPLLLSLLLYVSFNLFSSTSPIYYIIGLTCISSLGLLTRIDVLKNILKIKAQINVFSRFMAVMFLFLLSICFLRIFFWPINWDDQIYYIEQAYAIGQERSMNTYNDWGVFDNGILRFNSNPAIRPGIPLLYSISSLFSNRLSTVVVFSQFMTFYFLAIFITLIFIISRKIYNDNWIEKGLLTNLLIFSSYQFIGHTIQGFKELPIACLVLLSLSLPYELNFRFDLSKLFYLGLLLGLASYINISGSLIAILVVIIYFLQRKNNIKIRLKETLIILSVLILFSGFEFLYAFSWTFSGGAKTFDFGKYVQNTLLKDEVTFLSKYKSSEYNAYKISGIKDIFIKGKLQAFFQLNYFGIVFPVFLAILLFRYKKILSNKFISAVLVFICLYYLILIDIFGLNPNTFAYVTTVSQKYTVLISPFVVLVLVSQWDLISMFINKLSYMAFLITTIFSLVLVAVFNFFGQDMIFKFISLVIPILNETQYYKSVIGLGFKLSFVVFILISISLMYVKAYWHKYRLAEMYLLAILFFLPVLFFFHTNYGLDYTLLNSFSNKETKLSKIKGWENMYLLVNQLNKIPKNSTILLSNQPYQQMAIHLNIPSANIEQTNYLNACLNLNLIKPDFIVINNDNYLIMNNSRLVYSNNNKSVYTSYFSD